MHMINAHGLRQSIDIHPATTIAMTAPFNKTDYQHIASGFNADPASSSSLHKDAYTQQRYLELERQAIFAKSWQFICHEEKVAKPGQYITATIQGQAVFVIRQKNGELSAYYNVCKHRAHELLNGEGKTAAITCPYHAWTYELNGKLKAARHCEHLKNFSRDDISLDTVQVETFCSLVFINLDPDAVPLRQASVNLADEINHYAPDLASLTHAKRLTYTIKANWKAVVDNFLECYHCPVAHRDFCSLIDMDTYQVTTHGIYSSHMAKAKLDDNNAYNIDNASVTDHAVWFLWPNTALMRYPGRGNFMVWRFYPIDAETTYEVFDFYFETNTVTAEEEEAIAFIDDVLQPEDIGLVESVQRGMNTPAFQQGRYIVDPSGSGMSEHAVHHFHGLVLAAYAKACRQ